MQLNRPITYTLDADDSPTGEKITIEALRTIDPSLIIWDEKWGSWFYQTPSYQSQLSIGWADTLGEIEVRDFPPMLGEVLASSHLFSFFASLDIALIRVEDGSLKAFVHYQEYGSSSCRGLHCQPDDADEVQDLGDYFESKLFDFTMTSLVSEVDRAIHPYVSYGGSNIEVPWIHDEDQAKFHAAGFAFIAQLQRLQLL